MNLHSEDMRAFIRGYDFTQSQLRTAPVGPRPDWMGPAYRPLVVDQPWRDLMVGDSTLRVRRTGNRHYDLELVSGPWPEIGALAHACDLGTTYGGVLTRQDATHAHLEVYI